MKIYNLEDKLQYLDEVSELEYDEWAMNKDINREERLCTKKNKIKALFSNRKFCKLILVSGNELVGFISLFPSDCNEETSLTPWYATMYVKAEFRGNEYSKILNDAILNEAYNRGFDTLYLKTDLKNYYEKFGAIFIKNLSTGEKLYKIKTKK